MKKNHTIKSIILSVFITLISSNSYGFGWYGEALNGMQCSDIGNGQGHGPFDYYEIKTTTNKKLKEVARLWEVDKIHYGLATKRLKDGMNYINVNLAFGDYDYTLRAFPNHTLALRDAIELEINRIKINSRGGATIPPFRTPPECYLQRAAAFTPKQPHIPLLHGIYLYKLGKYPEAEAQYKHAIKIDADNTEAHYNLGLLYAKQGRFKEALIHAQRAYALHYPLEGLKRQLIDAGVWVETNEQPNTK